MSLWRQLTRGFGVLTNRAASDQDVADEVDHYLEESTAAREAGGLSPKEARRAAQLELGNVTVVREGVRAYGWENGISGFLDDVRFAVRRLCRSPGFAAVSLLTLTLGIGSNTAIFSLICGVLLKPLPYPQAERLIALSHTAAGVNISDLRMSPSLYFTYRDENRVFEDLSLWSTSTSSITGNAEPEEVPVLMVTSRLLPVLKVQPFLGRTFSSVDEGAGSNPTVILSNGYWNSHFGGDRSMLGRSITIDGNPTEVIGVLPPSFEFLDQEVFLLLPLQFDRAKVFQVNFSYRGIARLKQGATIQQANADIARMLPMVPAKFPPNPGFSANTFTHARIAPNLRFLKDDLVGNSGNTLWVLMATVGIVLLIACANIANLSLVRADGRQQELAVRVALGARWGRITRELLAESLLLSVTGGILGLVLAELALRFLVSSGLSPLPRVSTVSIDPVVVVFTLGISVASGLLFGLIPVFKYAHPELLNLLRSGGRSISQSKDRHRARNFLVITQVALAVVLLVSSGLMIRTFQALHDIDPGFSGAQNVQTIGISVPETQAKEPGRTMQIQEQILRKIEGLPGVSSVAITRTVPMDGGPNDAVYVEDQTYREGTLPTIRRHKYISPGYVSTIGSRLVAGRDFTWADTYNQTPVALISANLARELWRDPQAALGKRIRKALTDDWREVVGVLADLRDKGVDQDAPAIAYWPLLEGNHRKEIRVQRSVAFVIRTPRAGSAALLKEIRQAVWSVNPNLPVANVRTLQAVYDGSLARTSFTLVLLAIAGAMALLLGIVGIYGVISYSVSQRTREIGIRLALGAPLNDVTKLFVGHGLMLSLVGAVCGLATALVLTQLMKALLFQVSPADPLTYAAVSAGLILAATLASYLPARRAATIDPAVALRAE
ncbi:MAG: ABC transporter permease [Bryobacteraceae bacterium]|nr:ABC transporter permease [Bryobacteraceae bacterium]